MIQVAVLGYGTIGSGVVEVLETNHEIIARNAGDEIGVKYVLDLREFPGTSIEHKVIHDFAVIEQDPEVLIVVETMGGLNPAYPFVKACLEAGKHVVTSNKALVAAHGTELLAIARDKKVNFSFEASVGGGIPIIRPLSKCLLGERIEEITGILNGTTNYILTKMNKEGMSFESALKKAQELGYAERDPEADVEGHDTCRKLAILTAMATGKEVNYEDIYTEGITQITDVDFRYADVLGMSIKLFGVSQIGEKEVHAFVTPVMINQAHPLCSVSDVYNGIVVKSNMLGTSMYYGSGAGKLPTASAVLADIIDAAKHLHLNVPTGWTSQRLEVSDMNTSKHGYFVRLSGSFAERSADIKELYGEVQEITLDGLDEFAVLTKCMTESDFKQASIALELRIGKRERADDLGIKQMIRVKKSEGDLGC